MCWTTSRFYGKLTTKPHRVPTRASCTTPPRDGGRVHKVAEHALVIDSTPACDTRRHVPGLVAGAPNLTKTVPECWPPPRMRHADRAGTPHRRRDRRTRRARKRRAPAACRSAFWRAAWRVARRPSSASRPAIRGWPIHDHVWYRPYDFKRNIGGDAPVYRLGRRLVPKVTRAAILEFVCWFFLFAELRCEDRSGGLMG